MNSIKLIGHLAAFALCFAAGTAIAGLFGSQFSYTPVSNYKCSKKVIEPSYDPKDFIDVPAPPAVVNSKNIRIIAKPRPQYTETARDENTQGTVILSVTFLADGNIGPIKVVKSLENGLTQTAIDAAKKIRFVPAVSAGHAISVVKQVEYTYSIY